MSGAPNGSVSEGKRVLSEWTRWVAGLLLTPNPGALLLSRLGGAHRQPRQDLLCGPREQDHDVAAAHGAPRPAGAAEVQLHPADGAAEPQVRAVRCQALRWGWAHGYLV